MTNGGSTSSGFARGELFFVGYAGTGSILDGMLSDARAMEATDADIRSGKDETVGGMETAGAGHPFPDRGLLPEQEKAAACRIAPCIAIRLKEWTEGVTLFFPWQQGSSPFMGQEEGIAFLDLRLWPPVMAMDGVMA